jgi:hypothetical protein
MTKIIELEAGQDIPGHVGDLILDAEPSVKPLDDHPEVSEGQAIIYAIDNSLYYAENTGGDTERKVL